MRLPRLGPGEEAPSCDWCSRPRLRGALEAAVGEVSGSRVGVTGVTEVTIGDGGSGATGERTTMLMASERDREVADS